jgi:hypothetical protein
MKVQEQPVPKSDIPGEETSPTQPYPLKPPPLARQSMTAAELTNVTPESHTECLALTEGAKLDVKIYTPLRRAGPGYLPGPEWRFHMAALPSIPVEACFS